MDYRYFELTQKIYHLKARKYINRIEVWRDAEHEDGFGGYTTVPEKVDNSWCNIKTISSSRLTDFGITDQDYALKLELRHRNDLDYEAEDIFLKYKDISYIVQTVVPRDLENYEIQIIAVKRNE